MLSTSKVIGFVGTSKPDESRDFYEKRLGLQLLEESPFALVFASGDTTVRVQKVETSASPPYTSLGWEVVDIVQVVRHLTAKGVEFLRFEGLAQNEDGVWLTPDGSQIAWFKDPDGNTLSLTEFYRKPAR